MAAWQTRRRLYRLIGQPEQFYYLLAVKLISWLIVASWGLLMAAVVAANWISGH